MAQLIFFNSMFGLPISLFIKYVIWIADDWSITTRITLFLLSLLDIYIPNTFLALRNAFMNV